MKEKKNQKLGTITLSLPMILVIELIVIIASTVISHIAAVIFNSSHVYYNSTNSNIQSGNELYACTSNFSTYNAILSGFETTIGNNALTTNNKSLTGAINELKIKTNNAYGGYTPSITCDNSSFAVDNVDFKYRASGGLLWISGRFRIVTAATSNPSAIYITLPRGYTSFGDNVGSCGSVHLGHAYTGVGLSLRVGGSTYIWIQSDAGNIEAGTLIGTGYVIVDAVIPIN